jgi:hypothetical protein
MRRRWTALYRCLAMTVCSGRHWSAAVCWHVNHPPGNGPSWRGPRAHFARNKSPEARLPLAGPSGTDHQANKHAQCHRTQALKALQERQSGSGTRGCYKRRLQNCTLSSNATCGAPRLLLVTTPEEDTPARKKVAAAVPHAGLVAGRLVLLPTLGEQARMAGNDPGLWHQQGHHDHLRWRRHHYQCKSCDIVARAADMPGMPGQERMLTCRAQLRRMCPRLFPSLGRARARAGGAVSFSAAVLVCRGACVAVQSGVMSFHAPC